MEDIKEIISKITKGCSQAGVHVPDILAAFVARTVRRFVASLFISEDVLFP